MGRPDFPGLTTTHGASDAGGTDRISHNSLTTVQQGDSIHDANIEAIARRRTWFRHFC